ncbi:uncharacterized protein At5g01610-like [Tasmannia lanceolata]|uniref:uncharacterized protein At5g01610-like n=1 Tax=Tasmannia lanceolata TaxID=3420 RepID=UPI004063B1A5
MSNSPKLFLAALLFYIITVSASNSETPNSVHDILPEFGLPKGLLPDSVTTYSLSDDGTFVIELSHSCYVQFSDLVYYSNKITGKLSYGSISDLSGIQAKKVFIWVPVTGIEMDPGSDEIEFHVGFLSEKLPAKQFESIPTCKNKAYGESLRTAFSNFVEV